MNFSDKDILARRYAQAYLAVIGARSLELEPPVFYAISAWLSDNADVVSLLSYISDAAFGRCVSKLLSHHGLPSSLQPLLVLLRTDKRVALLARVLYSIGRVLDQQRNVHRATLYCDPLLEQEHVERVNDYLSRKIGGSVRSYVVHDPALIAGVRVIAKDWSWEKSIAKKVRMLQALCLLQAT